MKRTILITSTAATFLALAILPAAASAEHHHRHHHRSARVRVLSFGTNNPSAPASDRAGTVTSFTGGVLTIKLTDGSSVVGRVTSATELKCESGSGSTTARMADHGGGEGSGDGRGGSSDDQKQGVPGNQPGDDIGEDVNDNEANDVNDNDANDVNDNDANGVNDAHDEAGEACEMSSLREGAGVRNAELSVSSAGATFVEVEIIL